jgi:hypothetical protein
MNRNNAKSLRNFVFKRLRRIRNPHAVRNWLKKFIESGNSGLSRKYSAGKPGEIREQVKNRKKQIISHFPEVYDYTDIG